MSRDGRVSVTKGEVMTKFRLTIDMDNAAFEDDPGELARCLRDVASLVAPGKEWQHGNVRDINGNTVGTFKVYR
jgi:hypothetical protein